MIEFFDGGPKVEPTMHGVQAIHRQLFQDVYDWAGQLRTINIGKDESLFLPVEFFARGIEHFERTLRDDDFLKGLDRDRFIERLAVNFDNLNVLHPFREGNGRTQRVFWSVIARDAGWDIQWSRISAQENIQASAQALVHADYEPLKAMFARCVTDPSGLASYALPHDLGEPFEGAHCATNPDDEAKRRYLLRYDFPDSSRAAKIDGPGIGL